MDAADVPNDLFAYVSRRSHEEGLRPRFVVHDEPITPEDSGWQVLVGDESPAELDDPGSVLLQSLSSVVERWPELLPLLDTADVGSEWVWDEAAQAYIPYRQD